MAKLKLAQSMSQNFLADYIASFKIVGTREFCRVEKTGVCYTVRNLIDFPLNNDAVPLSHLLMYVSPSNGLRDGASLKTETYPCQLPQ